MYSIKEIRNITEGLRYIYPSLTLDNTIDNLEKAVESFGVEVRYSFMSSENRNVSGYLMTEDSKPVIVLNAAESEKRRRFTMAHELGHLILHWNWLPGDVIEGGDGVFEVSYRKESLDYETIEELEREGEADTFAGEFLLPLDEVKSTIEKFKDGNIIEKLGDRFKVSNPCAYVRYSNLRLEGEI